MHARVADGGAKPRLPRYRRQRRQHSVTMMTRALLCMAFALHAADAYGEIYRCAGKRGMTVYQNFPCTFDSLGSVSADAAPEAKPAARPAPPKAVPAPARAAATSTAVSRPAIQPTPAGASNPQPGMNEDGVRKAWGEPDEIIQDEPPSGRVEIWTIQGWPFGADHRKHRVVAVQL